MRCSVDGVAFSGPLTEVEIDEVWPKVEPYLSAALEHEGLLDSQQLLSQMGNGLWGLYVVRDELTDEILGAACCEVQEWPRGNVFNVAYCGGVTLYRWAGFLGALEAEAVRYDCETVRITGRKGWGGVYPEYREVSRVFERKVVING